MDEISERFVLFVLMPNPLPACRAAWEVAVRVAHSEQCSGVESKAILLAFALRHADAGQVRKAAGVQAGFS